MTHQQLILLSILPLRQSIYLIFLVYPFVDVTVFVLLALLQNRVSNLKIKNYANYQSAFLIIDLTIHPNSIHYEPIVVKSSYATLLPVPSIVHSATSPSNSSSLCFLRLVETYPPSEFRRFLGLSDRENNRLPTDRIGCLRLKVKSSISVL